MRGPGILSEFAREMTASAVSMANGCRYRADSHVASVIRRGADERAVTEVNLVCRLCKMAFEVVLFHGDHNASASPRISRIVPP